MAGIDLLVLVEPVPLLYELISIPLAPERLTRSFRSLEFSGLDSRLPVSASRLLRLRRSPSVDVSPSSVVSSVVVASVVGSLSRVVSSVVASSSLLMASVVSVISG